jgi:hypothetical protein
MMDDAGNSKRRTVNVEIIATLCTRVDFQMVCIAVCIRSALASEIVSAIGDAIMRGASTVHTATGTNFTTGIARLRAIVSATENANAIVGMERSAIENVIVSMSMDGKSTESEIAVTASSMIQTIVELVTPNTGVMVTTLMPDVPPVAQEETVVNQMKAAERATVSIGTVTLAIVPLEISIRTGTGSDDEANTGRREIRFLAI